MTTPNPQTPKKPTPNQKLIPALAIAAGIVVLIIVYMIIARPGTSTSEPSPTGSVIYNQPTNPTPSASAPAPTSSVIGGTNVNGQPLYKAPAESVAKFCKAWATAGEGKDAFIKNITPYVTDEVLEGLKYTDPRNLTTDNPALTDIVINPVAGTDRTYNAYCVYNRESYPRYGGTFTSTDGSTWVLSEPNDPVTDPQVIPDNRPTPERTSSYKLN